MFHDPAHGEQLQEPKADRALSGQEASNRPKSAMVKLFGMAGENGFGPVSSTVNIISED